MSLEEFFEDIWMIIKMLFSIDIEPIEEGAKLLRISAVSQTIGISEKSIIILLKIIAFISVAKVIHKIIKKIKKSKMKSRRNHR